MFLDINPTWEFGCIWFGCLIIFIVCDEIRRRNDAKSNF